MKPKPVVSKDGSSVTVRVPLTFRQQGGRKRIVVPGGGEPMRPPPNSYERDAMVKALARAFRWRRLLENGDYGSVGDLAKAEGVNFSYMCRVLRLTLLSPKIVESILDARVGSELSLHVLLRPNSMIWNDQEALLRQDAPTALAKARGPQTDGATWSQQESRIDFQRGKN